MITFNILFDLFLTLYLSLNIYITTSECERCHLAPDEPTLECTKTTTKTLKFNIVFNLPLHQTVQYK